MRTKVFGSTNLGDRPDIRNVAVVVTDGKPTPELGASDVAAEAARAQAEGVTMFAVGVTNSIDKATLRALSSDPKEENMTYFATPNFDGLNRVLDSLIAVVCHPPPPMANCEFK